MNRNSMRRRERNNEGHRRNRTRDFENRGGHRSPIDRYGRDDVDERQFRMREIRQVHYEHEPAEMRERRMKRQRDNNRNRNRDGGSPASSFFRRPPRKGNNIYDCNDIDNIDNLSLQFYSHSEHESDSENIEIINPDMNVSIPLNKNPQE